MLGAVGFSPVIVPCSVLGADGRARPSNRVTLGSIGIGGEGTRNLMVFLGQPDAQVVAVCDVDPAHRNQARDRVNQRYQNKDCACYVDFREIIARDDIDAVCISTPDHWHVPISLMAIRSGKDAICEKPTLTIAEGRALSNAVSRHARVFQTSTEDRSLAVYHRMAELVRNGRIGKLQRIYVKLPAGPGEPGDPTPQPVPPGFAYDLWLGPAPFSPYCPARIHWNFRWITDYSGGMLTDWGAHLIDTAQWANDTERTGPVQVEGTGKRHVGGLYDTCYEYQLRYQYASGVEMFVASGGVALRFEGTDGWIGNNGWVGPLEASSKAILDTVIGPNELHLYTCPAGEHRNFLDCVKSRKDPYFPAEIGHRCCSVMHVGNIAIQLGRTLRWDPARERFADDDTANRMLSRSMREPWRL
jgi:predicted dehydrogenase